MIHSAIEVDDPTPHRKMMDAVIPDGSAYWRDWPESQLSCYCDPCYIGRPNTPNRWTCRKCGGKVQRGQIRVIESQKGQL